MYYTEFLEKCERCYTLVHTERQTRGICHDCLEEIGVMPCGSCGDLFKNEQLTEDYECLACATGCKDVKNTATGRRVCRNCEKEVKKILRDRKK